MGQKNFTVSLQFCLILKLGSQAILLYFVSDAGNFLEFWNNWKECMIFNCKVDKTLITFSTTMLKGLWRILFMMVLFSRSYLYKKYVNVLCFWKFKRRLMSNPWLYINCFHSPRFQCIIIEWGVVCF